MRLFVALDIPEEVRRSIAELVEKLRPAVRGARWARVEGTHVTLKFIGEVAPEKLGGIEAALVSVGPPGAIEMRFRKVGFFPNERHPRVFWAGIDAPPALADLAAQVEQRLEPLGIPRETRPFRPHLTLARFNSLQGLPELQAALGKLAPFEFGAARAEEFYLYQSRLKPGGAEYTRLRTFPLAGATR